ncbi:MAG: glucose-6-phosphate dehydrogenase [Candidatus Azambacteria bacterium]|nr:glucose-6-phosphate dehydrogenase [Candidatus Azambacteria bacterium]
MDTKLNFPTIFVIFGATGDLARRKIFPALFELKKKGMLPDRFALVAFSRREWDDTMFRGYVQEMLGTENTKKEVDAFLKLIYFQNGIFEDKKSYDNLHSILKRIDGEWKLCTNKLFYLATPPEYYKGILAHLHRSGLTTPCSPEEGFTRVLVEKPFGKDLATAEALDILLGKLFKEEQIYRIDHYLGKEMLQNILHFRFSNNLLEDVWSNKYIERVEVRLWEKKGVETRGAFYDGLGALRDVGQNHLLQMAALVAMEQPAAFTAEAVRESRAAILGTVKVFNVEEIKQQTFRAQYRGYRDIAGVKNDSRTETYFKTQLFFDHPRWQGVAFTLESGKRMQEQKKEIIVHFRHPQPCLCPDGKHVQNTVQFTIEPKEEIRMNFWAKKPGLTNELAERALTFTYRETSERVQYIEEYERLLVDAIAGDQTLFLSTNEVTAMWKFIDPIVHAWNKKAVALASYTPDTFEAVTQAQQIKHASAMPKKIGIVGLGKMGGGITMQLLEKGWGVVGTTRDAEKAENFKKKGMKVAVDYADLVGQLSHPRVVWVMVTAGAATEETIFGKHGLVHYLEKGDILIDGGNSFYKDSIRRAKLLKKKGIRFVDVGVSGGPGGARRGACIMVGGERASYEYLNQLFLDFTVSGGVEFFDGHGAGHFVKMVHNGIEYGMMQAIAEGFAILKKSKLKLDLARVTDIYNHGSVIESKLINWLAEAFDVYGQELKAISGSVKRTGEGDWTVNTAKELGVRAKIIEESVKFRKLSEKKPEYAGKVLSALRNRFGGHAIK